MMAFSGQWLYWDGRSYATPAWLDFSGNKGSCRDNAGTYGFVTPLTGSIPGASLTLCQGFMPNWVSGWNQGRTLTASKAIEHAIGAASIADCVEVLSAALVHEFSHIGVVMGGQQYILGQLQQKTCRFSHRFSPH